MKNLVLFLDRPGEGLVSHNKTCWKLREKVRRKHILTDYSDVLIITKDVQQNWNLRIKVKEIVQSYVRSVIYYRTPENMKFLKKEWKKWRTSFYTPLRSVFLRDSKWNICLLGTYGRNHETTNNGCRVYYEVLSFWSVTYILETFKSYWYYLLVHWVYKYPRDWSYTLSDR